MLTANHLYVQGRHSDLLAPTSLSVAPGEVLLAQADDASARTALALTLSGRMKPTSGSVQWNRDASLAHLRRRSALLDSPGVNEPEPHLQVKDLVAEDLALTPRADRPKTSPAAWLKARGFGDCGNLWIEQLPSPDRIRLLIALALTDSRVDLLVLDSPDRHQADPGAWLPVLEEAVADALANGDGRELAVVAAVAQLPAHWDGPTVLAEQAGSDDGDDDGDALPAETADSDSPEAANTAEADDAADAHQSSDPAETEVSA